MAQEYMFKVKGINSGEIWEEHSQVPDGQNPEKYFQGLLKSWNKDFPDNQRRLIKVLNETDNAFCEFTEKINNFTISRNGEMYDIWQCKLCKLYVKRPTVEMPQRKCKPDQSCLECNKIFVSVKSLQKHNERNNHKTPNWIPDGV